MNKMQLQGHIPTTGRKTAFQLRQLGCESVSEFAAVLPPKAVVVDVGAGLSRLGHEVAAIRADIRWINIDPCYGNRNLAAEAQKASPTNLELWSEDIVQGSSKLTKLHEKVDLVYSYWMLPHLSLESDEPAKAAVENMYDLLKPEGQFIAGPTKRLGFGFFSPYRYRGTVKHSKLETKQQVAQNVLEQTKLWWLPRMIQRLANKHNVHFGTLFVGGRRKPS